MRTESIRMDETTAMRGGGASRRARLLAALAGGLAAAGAWAQGVVEVKPLQAPEAAPTAMIDETPRRWFVELAGAPTSEGNTAAAVESEHRAFREEAARAGVRYSEHHAYRSLFNGFSVGISPRDVGKLRALSGVKTIYPGSRVTVSSEPAATPDLFTALGMTGADVAQSALGLSGRGVRVGIIDTGIDYDNADLGGDGVARSNSPMFPTQRVIAGYDFVGDDYNADDPGTVAIPDPYPDDCAGHGTHVSGIVGANGFVTGVAPQVKFGAYRIFGCAGSANDDVILAAMERALDDGMDVINMSLGSDYSWPQSPLGLASNRLVRRGVVVVAAAGNAGATGLYSGGSPGWGRDAIGVASFDNVGVYLTYFTASPDAARFGWLQAAAAPAAPTSGTFPLARTGTPTTTNDGCNALPAGSLAGQVVLIRRGTCSFNQKSVNAQNAGAAGVVIYNNTTGFINATVAGTPAVTIPVVTVTAADGAILDGRIAAGPTTMTWTDQQASFPSATGNLISSFSAYGFTPDLDLKPDIGAPGGNIYSTFPLELGGHASLSGTSMATPHVAGAVALLLQARPHTRASEVRDILQGAAAPHLWWGAPALGFLDNVTRQGSGMLRIDDAITSQVTVSPAKLALGESQAGPRRVEIRVRNDGRSAVTYDLSFVNALSVNNTFAPAFFTSDASVTFSRPSVRVAAREDAEFHATITPPTSPDKAQYGGYLVLTPRGGGAVKRVAFAGFVGDYQSIQVLAPTPFGFPWLAVLFPDGFAGPVTGPADWVYSMVGDDIPYFLVHLDHQSRLLQIDIQDAATGRLLGQALSSDYNGRNSSATSFFAYPWDGTVIRGRRIVTLPDGNYVAKISVLKALGHAFDPADWETWTSPVIAIDRP